MTSKIKLCSVEKVTLVYMALTTILTFIFWNGLNSPWSILGLRGIVLGIMLVTNLIYRAAAPNFASEKMWPMRIFLALRTFPLIFMLACWYPELYDFASQMPYKDHWFASIDQNLFGCQPSLIFDTIITSTFWSEAFNMGYYLYYYMIGGTILFYLLCRYDQFDKAGFILMTSFFIFYFVFIFLPVAGPQFYFKALLDQGIISPEFLSTKSTLDSFPDIAYYFKDHTEMLSPEPKGIFSQLVIGAQEMGERPIAAFPSSHVGVSTVVMLLAYKSRNRWLFWSFMPFFILLSIATVYIKAHYLIDSICGFFFALLCFYISSRLARRWA